jgi:hypothetical protein
MSAAAASDTKVLPKGAYERPDGETMLPIGPHQAIGETAYLRLGLSGRVRG